MTGVSNGVYFFGSYRLDAAGRVLTRSGEVVALPPKTFDLLVVLVQSNGCLLSKQKLMDSLWNGAFVEEGNLAFQVSTLRKALGEDAVWIEPVPKHGYRFKAPVEQPESGNAVPIQAEPTVLRAKPWRPLVLIVGSALVFVAFISWVLLRHSAGPLSAERAPWQQLTFFSDVATNPALSPDGRLLAFKRGGTWFSDSGQIYIKQLPAGEAVPLTHDNFAKMSPAFSPDGSSVFYTAYGPGTRWWDTWEVPVFARREPQRFLANAEALTWIDQGHVLFSEIRESPHMAVVTSEPGRAAIRDVYVPSAGTGMAHFSAVSPDHKGALIAEMQGTGTNPFLRCRWVPLDSSSKGAFVGPAGECLGAAWSTNGHWMYFSVRQQSGEHIWRQKWPNGEPEQITFGPTGEIGVAPTPDGLSIITSVGADQSTVWLSDGNGERQISGEGYATSPVFSPDGSKIFYLVGMDLWVSDLAGLHPEHLLPGKSVTRFAISPDGRAFAYQTGDGELWYAPLDQKSPPSRLLKNVNSIVINISFSGDVFVISSAGSGRTLSRIHPDGSGLRVVATDPNLVAISPDEKWVVAKDSTQQWDIARPLPFGAPVTLCYRCLAGWEPSGKFLWITLRTLTGGGGVTGFIPLRGKNMLPQLPSEGIRTAADFAKVPGVTIVPYEIAVPGPAHSVYAFEKIEAHRNLYRVPLP